jgi:methylamine dehydrogenase accessory protein MauD
VTALIVSQAVLWVVVIALCVTVLALARQIGVLHERVAPAGALNNGAGPGVGEKSPRLEVHALAGNAITIGSRSRRARRCSCYSCPRPVPFARS